MTIHTLTFDFNVFNNEAALRDLWRADKEARKAEGHGDESIVHWEPDATTVTGYDGEWYGLDAGVNPATAIVDMVQHGSPEALAGIQKCAKEAIGIVAPSARSIKPSFSENRSTGQRYDLERVLSGRPGQWGRWERGERVKNGNRIVALYLTLGGHSGLSAKEMMWGPVSGAVIADILERAGYRVEIWGSCGLQAHGVDVYARALLKDADQPIDLLALTRAMHPATARAIMYPAIEVDHKRLGRGYGRVSLVHPEAFGETNCIAIPGTYNLESTAAQITSVIERFNGKEV